MTTGNKHFFLKLIPPRPSFAMDMTGDEKEIMGEHVAYLTHLLKESTILVFGPVLDPAGVYGMAVVQAEDEAAVKDLTKNDPALKMGSRYEIFPMMATVKP